MVREDSLSLLQLSLLDSVIFQISQILLVLQKLVQSDLWQTVTDVFYEFQRISKIISSATSSLHRPIDREEYVSYQGSLGSLAIFIHLNVMLLLALLGSLHRHKADRGLKI